MSNTFTKPTATLRSITGIPTGRLAVWWVIGSEIVIFGGLIATYLLLRFRHGDIWIQEATHTKLEAGAINTFVLLTSSLFVVLAHQAAEQGNGKKAARLLGLTTLGGLIFLGVKSWEWTTEISHGFTLGKNLFWSFYYVMTGLHGIHVVAGMIIMCLIAKDAYQNRELQRVELIGIYWHFVDIVWLFLFPIFYTTSSI